jgi:hypothetical protein
MLIDDAVTVPVLSAGPTALMHSPTFNAPDVVLTVSA